MGKQNVIYLHNSAIKMNEIWMQVATWMNLANMMLSEKRPHIVSTQ